MLKRIQVELCAGGEHLFGGSEPAGGRLQAAKSTEKSRAYVVFSVAVIVDKAQRAPVLHVLPSTVVGEVLDQLKALKGGSGGGITIEAGGPADAHILLAVAVDIAGANGAVIPGAVVATCVGPGRARDGLAEAAAGR